jgi:aspartate carbamoyltransferase catalytic subunit
MPGYRHLTTTAELDRVWVESEVFPACEALRQQSEPDPVLKGHALYCLFYEPSFLTRTSFERAIGLLGGQAYHTEDASQFFPVRTPNYVDNIISILASLHVNLVVLRSNDAGVVERARVSDVMPVINGGSADDHPTQALADLYTLHRELGGLDGIKLAIVGRLEHRNVNALLRGLALFKNVQVTLIPFSGSVAPEVSDYCESRGVELLAEKAIEAVREVDAIYLNGPRTVAHVQLMRSRNSYNLRIDDEFMSMLKPHCVILDPMQRSGDFSVEVQDPRLAFYRQAENALYVRMAVLCHALEAAD